MSRFFLVLLLVSLVLVSCSKKPSVEERLDALERRVEALELHPAESPSSAAVIPVPEAPARVAVPTPPPAASIARTGAEAALPSMRAAQALAAAKAPVRTARELTVFGAAPGSGAKSLSRTPYRGAIAFDAATGSVLFEDNPDELAVPASMAKMMLLLLVQERIENGHLRTTDMVAVSNRAYNEGGSQVWLDPKETFPLEDLLYALMIQSANDAAVAIAEHVAGSVEAMVALMNDRAAKLGMRNTRFVSCNGLTSVREPADVTTARDMAILAAALCSHPDIFKYTGTDFRVFRPDKAPGKGLVEMRTHNPLLQKKVPGCDGLKTGYTAYAGYSIAATVKRGDTRVVLVLMGCPDKATRDANLNRLLEQAFANAAADSY